MKKVLITGALGQDGIILSKLYQKKKFKVFGFVKTKQKASVKKVIYKINNLKSKNKIKNHLQAIKPSIIVHLASTNNSYSKRKNKKNYKINYVQNFKCTKNLLNSVVENKLKTKARLIHPKNKPNISAKTNLSIKQDIDTGPIIIFEKNKYFIPSCKTYRWHLLRSCWIATRTIFH